MIKQGEWYFHLTCSNGEECEFLLRYERRFLCTTLIVTDRWKQHFLGQGFRVRWENGISNNCYMYWA